MRIEIDPKIFNTAYLPYLEEYARTQIYYGGSSSGKSVFLAQRTIYDILHGGRNYLVCRAVGRTIRKSVFNEICKVIADWGIIHLFNINKTDLIITCENGYQIYFVGLDDTEKIKSIVPQKGVITDIWIEEATECDDKTVKNLYKRQRGGRNDVLKRMILSFNPILKSHWIYKKYFVPINWADDQTQYNDGQLSILKTWYIHNRFLTDADIHDLENEEDTYFYNVYTLGNWGVLGNVIFANWQVLDLSEIEDQFTNTRNGLDFGFSTDPAGALSSHYDQKRKTIYIFNELYETGLTNDILAVELLRMVGRNVIYCDSAEPKSIAELRQHGVNARAAQKGKDSVVFGIQWLQQQNIIIDKKCVNTRNEIEQYKWKEDKDGNAIRQPVDKMNHLIDALRYAYERDMISSKAKYQAVDWYKPPKKENDTWIPAHTEDEIEKMLDEQGDK
jgi:phage terminase large subunit